MAITDTKAQIRIINSAIRLGDKDFASNAELQSKRFTKSRELSNLFQRDLYMFAEGDLFATEDAANQDDDDLRRIAGVYNYAQAITHRLMTARGTLPADSTFGIPWNQYLGQTYASKEIIVTNLTRDIQDELYKDSRTQRVVSANVAFQDPNTIDVKCVLLPIGLFDEVSINVIIGIV